MLVQHAQQLECSTIDQQVMHKVIRSKAVGMFGTRNTNVIATAPLPRPALGKLEAQAAPHPLDALVSCDGNAWITKMGGIGQLTQ